jgi:hypothetical protein
MPTVMHPESMMALHKRIPQWVDSVEKVSKMKLWNQSLKQSNPSKWSFESMLLVRRSP